MMPPRRLLPLSGLMLLLVLPGCGGESGEVELALEPDPAIVAALAEPIMIDPDLATQNRGNAAIVIGTFDGIPAWTRDPDEIARARAAAVRLAGGTLQAAPAAERQPHPDAPSKTPRQLAASLPGISARCLSDMRDGFARVSDLPKAAEVYPGGHVELAAGARGACRLVAVRYMTSAEPQDVLDFHYTLLAQRGYRVERDGDVLMARKGRSSAQIGVTQARGGMPQVALATSN